jgi:hypothetical protein
MQHGAWEFVSPMRVNTIRCFFPPFLIATVELNDAIRPKAAFERWKEVEPGERVQVSREQRTCAFMQLTMVEGKKASGEGAKKMNFRRRVCQWRRSHTA